jgi:hypothetical protein
MNTFSLAIVPVKPIHENRRSMATNVTPGGKVVTCAACCWWAPVIGQDISGAAKEFDAHICTEHPSVKDIEKPSNVRAIDRPGNTPFLKVLNSRGLSF